MQFLSSVFLTWCGLFRYCQAVLKSLKTGRAPEVETWKQLVLSLEERIRTHQQVLCLLFVSRDF